jgi:magnesium-transporting ATPase (P-type)
MPQLTWAIIAVILINGMFSYWQEYKAGRAAEALRALLPVQVTIRRAGQQRLIPVSEVVPGDILVLAEGAAVPADARIIEAEQLRVDTSSLTGESRPVRRIAEPFSDTDRMAGTIPNLAFAGTFVTSGRGVAVVFATGTRTEFGRIAAMTVQQPERPSPLQEEIRRVTRLVTLLAIGMGALVVPPMANENAGKWWATRPKRRFSSPRRRPDFLKMLWPNGRASPNSLSTQCAKG